jgi:hypothetical protein
MDRASRFLWHMECGKKDKKLFKGAIKQLEKVIQKTQDLSLLTDGERRYGNELFEICHEILRNGKRGRPKKVLKKGVKVRVKNKGSRSHTKGRKPKKIQATKSEHPQTPQNLDDSDVHANHLEGFNATLRRCCSAYRRRSNTYAKAIKPLQKRLDLIWCLHNFVNKHFTTKQVPAVNIGVIETPFSFRDLFEIKLPN